MFKMVTDDKGKNHMHNPVLKPADLNLGSA